jgi:hypothetical protein
MFRAPGGTAVFRIKGEGDPLRKKNSDRLRFGGTGIYLARIEFIRVEATQYPGVTYRYRRYLDLFRRNKKEPSVHN